MVPPSGQGLGGSNFFLAGIVGCSARRKRTGSHGWKHFHRTLKLVLKLSQAQSSQPFCKGPTGPTGMGGM